jgi:hypothetical protein
MEDEDKEGRYLLNISVKEFIGKYAHKIDFDADFQREVIWSVEDQKRLLDSILINIDIPKMYLVETDEKNKQFRYECIDGKQRMTTLLDFIEPDVEGKPLKIRIFEKDYTYREFKEKFSEKAKEFDEYKLTFVVYKSLDDDKFLSKIFQRLQFGVRLNSGEILKSHIGNMRDFIYDEMKDQCPFLIKTNLSDRRFSREFTLSQLAINSFAKYKTEQFSRARLKDLEDFLDEHEKIKKDDINLKRIQNVLLEMDKAFNENASNISSRAVAVSAYLFCEALFLEKKHKLISKFSEFFVKLLEEIKKNMDYVSNYENPKNSRILNEFQKYILQASVEASSINKRHKFLKEAFEYYEKNEKILR